MNALQIAATGMSAQQMKVDVVSNNLANMSTTGYNARRADFADLHCISRWRGPARDFSRGWHDAAHGRATGPWRAAGLGFGGAGAGVAFGRRAAIWIWRSKGKGYLEVTLPSGGSAYTRDGSLKRSARWSDCYVGWLYRGARH